MPETDARELFVPERPAGATITLSAGAVSLSLVWCPAGTFTMGTIPDDALFGSLEETPHQVTLTQGFWIGQTPITRAQWAVVMDAEAPPGGNPRDAARPVERIGWTRAMLCCQRLTHLLQHEELITARHEIALPTEAQWEYACRAYTQTLWHFGDDASGLDEYGWYQENSDDASHPAATKEPNPWGIYDVYGNVSEWCIDDYYRYGEVPETDPCHIGADSQFKMIRGGNYSSIAAECRSGSRRFIAIDNPFVEETGLRVVCIPVRGLEGLDRYGPLGV